MNAAKKTPAKKSVKKSAKSPAGDKKDAAKPAKKFTKKQIILSVVFFFLLILWFGLQPLRAGIGYGICRTYVETRIRYPHTYKITKYDEFGASTRLFYTHTDPYGTTRSERIECIGLPDPANGYIMKDIKVNLESIGEEEVNKFNLLIPGIIAAKPDTIVPRPPRSNDLNELKRDD